MTLNSYILEPMAPLIIRSGRPFDGPSSNEQAIFPPPSTIAGALRTAYAKDEHKSGFIQFDPTLSELKVKGPLPIWIENDMSRVSSQHLLVPCPADLVFLQEAGAKAKIFMAQPSPTEEGVGSDLPNDLLPVQLLDPQAKGKPCDGVEWLSWEKFDQLRTQSSTNNAIDLDQLKSTGWTPPADEVRTHVAINSKTLAAENGKLFQTSGLSFSKASIKGKYLQQIPQAGRLGILASFQKKIQPGVLTLGGERRLTAIEELNNHQKAWPVCPTSLDKEIRQKNGLVLTVLTPAIFSAGWKPGWLNNDNIGSPIELPGVKLKLKAAAVNRWLPHSGWDLLQKQPRAGRKMVAAGAVYWFELLDGEWPDGSASRLWFSHISDHEQDQRDGYGLVSLHAWQAFV